VSMGSIISQTIDTSSGGGFIKETNHCGVIGGASAWLRFQPTQDGTVMIDTIGSRFDTVLAIYRDTNLLVLSSNPGAALVACDNNSAPDGIRSRLQYQTKAGSLYLAVVDGVQSAKGLATINWQLANAPIIVSGNSNAVGNFHGTVTLGSGITSSALVTYYRWFFNDVEIPGATNSTLTLTNLQPGQAGNYGVLCSNYAGYVMNTAAQLSVKVPLQLARDIHFEEGTVRGLIWGNLNESCILEVSSDLQNWSPIEIISIQSQPQPFTDPDAGGSTSRFYRLEPYHENP
ncbi:MAG TPA: hypothetical protein VMZ27_15655, partial [Candidatus Saccharimonadales bacterium]|nr:hypothetical protein [Candidatus Saccharimonadales bacterium]